MFSLLWPAVRDDRLVWFSKSLYPWSGFPNQPQAGRGIAPAEASERPRCGTNRAWMLRSGLTSSVPGATSGKRRFEHALAEFDHRRRGQRHVRSFQLDPTAAATSEGDPIDRLAAKYGMSRATAEAAQARVTANAATAGWTSTSSARAPGNTFDAPPPHPLCEVGREAGHGQGAADGGLFRRGSGHRRAREPSPGSRSRSASTKRRFGRCSAGNAYRRTTCVMTSSRLASSGSRGFRSLSSTARTACLELSRPR